MIIQITEDFLASLKSDLRCLKQAQDLAMDDEIIPDTSNQIGMQNLIEGGIVSIQEIIKAAEATKKEN